MHRSKSQEAESTVLDLCRAVPLPESNTGPSLHLRSAEAGDAPPLFNFRRFVGAARHRICSSIGKFCDDDNVDPSVLLAPVLVSIFASVLASSCRRRVSSQSRFERRLRNLRCFAAESARHTGPRAGANCEPRSSASTCSDARGADGSRPSAVSAGVNTWAIPKHLLADRSRADKTRQWVKACSSARPAPAPPPPSCVGTAISLCGSDNFRKHGQPAAACNTATIPWGPKSQPPISRDSMDERKSDFPDGSSIEAIILPPAEPNGLSRRQSDPS